MCHCIRKTLNIKDENITFDENYLTEEKYRNVLALVFNGTLAPKTPNSCPKFGIININYTIIKHGSKTTNTLMPRVSNRLAILRLKKQRFLCKSCNKTFTPLTDVVKFNHTISKNSIRSAVLGLKEKSSIVDIAYKHDISHSTLNNLLNSLSSQFIVNKTYLPPHLSFDEFKSVKGINANMSFIFTDSSTRVLDIVQNRQLGHLKSYFFSYSAEARNRVQTICIDMYAPYIELIKSCFPKAKIITDRFNVVQLINRSLNSSRIQTMKDYKPMYARLKRYWKLILKPNENLDSLNYKSFVCFKYKMTELEVVNELLRIDKEFENTYWYYQEFVRNFRRKNINRCISLIHNPRDRISSSMEKNSKNSKQILRIDIECTYLSIFQRSR